VRALKEDMLGEKDHTDISAMAIFREQITNAPPYASFRRSSRMISERSPLALPYDSGSPS